jgi:hypothetical protein
MFNKSAFLTAVRIIHQSGFESIKETEVRSKLDTVIDYDKSVFSKVLDNICNNIVGNTMFKLLLTKLPTEQKIKITNISKMEAHKTIIEQNGSSYANYDVWINAALYNSAGLGIEERQYYHVDIDGNIVPKRKTLAGSLFHEFTHCLHHVEDEDRYIAYSDIKSLPDGNLWSTKEELRTITGYDKEMYDPIYDHVFDYYQSIMKKELFYPRYSHYCCYLKDDCESNKIL